MAEQNDDLLLESEPRERVQRQHAASSGLDPAAPEAADLATTGIFDVVGAALAGLGDGAGKAAGAVGETAPAALETVGDVAGTVLGAAAGAARAVIEGIFDNLGNT